MNSERKKGISFLLLISGRKQRESLLKFLTNMDANVVNVSYGKGSVKSNSPLIEVFGFLPEEEKVVIICLMAHDKADLVIDRLEKKFEFNKPNTGIAFAVSVDGLSF